MDFGAAHPELFHFMVDAGRHADDRMHWLVDTHIRPWFAGIVHIAGADPRTIGPHVHYALVGAASLIFAVAPECKVLSGVDPRPRAAVARHADFVASLFVP